MSGPQGLWVYGSVYDYYWDAQKHRVRASKLRTYAKRSLGLVDGPNSAKICRNRAYKNDARNKWYDVPKRRDARCGKRDESCGTHRLMPDEIREFCINELEMQEPQPLVVEKIVETTVEVEVGISLSFEERDILTVALHREQHVANEMLRRAYEKDEHVQEIKMMVGRVRAITDLMVKLGIDPDNWMNGPAWLVDASLVQIPEEEPHEGEVNDPQTVMFGEGGQ